MRNMNKSTPKVVIIHGQSHTGSTCHVARELAEKLAAVHANSFFPGTSARSAQAAAFASTSLNKPAGSRNQMG